MNRLHLCIILITLKSWAFAYDFRAVDRYGNSLCFNLLSDSTAALTSEVAISFDSVVQNYPYLNCDTLYIPDSIEYDNYSYTICAIQGRALAYLNSVKRLYIPKTIIEIDNYSIGYKNSIQEFIVDNENPQFISKNGVLYSKDEKNLYCYPSNKIDSIFIIPEGVDNIEILAINNDIVKIIETPLSLKRIGVGALFSESIEELILQGEVNINSGAIYENVVAQELHAHGWTLRYFNSKKHGEVDFLLEQDDKIIPLEVKSGKDYMRHVALNNMMSSPESNISRAIVLGNSNLTVNGNILYAPVYMTMFLHYHEQSDSIIYKPDLP